MFFEVSLGETKLQIKLLEKMKINKSIIDNIRTNQLVWSVLIQRMNGNRIKKKILKYDP